MSTRRPYRLGRRAEQQQETRARIVEAAIELHQTIGPAATSFADIAEKAGVGRVTVYRHFADELELSAACSGLYFERHPFPDPERWRSVASPDRRGRRGLREAYAYHRATEAMLSHVLADARDHPALRPYHAHWRRCADVLAEAWPLRGRRRRLLRAALVVALGFDTWRALTRDEGLADAEAADAMAAMVSAWAGPELAGRG
jgi:AcrR family transcriptional regulator